MLSGTWNDSVDVGDAPEWSIALPSPSRQDQRPNFTTVVLLGIVDVSSSAATRGLRCAELATSEPLSAVQFYRTLLKWQVLQFEFGFDCWVGDRRCASVRTARHGQRGGWRVIFAGGTHDSSLTGPEDTHAGLVKGRAQHGPWAPSPRTGEPCWVDLLTNDGERADMFWSDTLHWTVQNGRSTSMYATEGRPVAIRSEPSYAHGLVGWLCYFTVDDVADARDQVLALDGQVLAEEQHSVMGQVLVVADPHGGVFALADTQRWGAVQS